MTNTQPKPQWEETFDKYIAPKITDHFYDTYDVGEVKNYIRQTLESLIEEIPDEIKAESDGTAYKYSPYYLKQQLRNKYL